jgi:hypothetical protein
MTLPRAMIAAVLLVSATLCPAEQPLKIVAERPKLDGGAWALSGAWQGYMGVAIQFRPDGTFRYWDYSDVTFDESLPKQPFRGRWRWMNSVLMLTSRQDLHATRWYVCSYHGQLCLLPKYARDWQLEDGKPHEDRLLFHIARFDDKHPQLNYGGFEHSDGTTSPISP